MAPFPPHVGTFGHHFRALLLLLLRLLLLLQGAGGVSAERLPIRPNMLLKTPPGDPRERLSRLRAQSADWVPAAGGRKPLV